MTMDLSYLISVLPLLVESVFTFFWLPVILVDWRHIIFPIFLLMQLLYGQHGCIRGDTLKDVHKLLLIVALGTIYHSLVEILSVNSEICKMAVVAIGITVSFWRRSKSKAANVSDKCTETKNIRLVNKSVGGSLVTHRDQETSASTCCGVGVSRNLLSLSSSPGPRSEVNIEEELRKPYVEAVRTQEDVTNEDLVTAIQYLNTLEGGIEVHRSAVKLMNALSHIQGMSSKSCMDDSGLPLDYSYKELRHIMVEERWYSLPDFERVLEKWLETNSFLPSPEEFVDFHHDMKGIVQLEKEVKETKREVAETKREVAETKREVAETKREVAETKREVEEKNREVEEKNREVEETTQEVVKTRQKNLSLRQRLQQKENIILQRDQALQQERQRVRQLERNPEGELQRRLRDLEEENRRLSAQSDRSKCKICRVEEVQVFFMPCNHLISCRECVDNLPEKICPMCRETIQEAITMFLA